MQKNLTSRKFNVVPLKKVEVEVKKTEPSTTDLLDQLIQSAYDHKASDIHIDPEEESIRVRFRVDGILTDKEIFSKSVSEKIISRIKILANLRTDEHQTPQDGRFQLSMKDEMIDIRVSIMPTYHGENVVMRLLVNQNEKMDFEGLSFSPSDKEKILQAIKKSCGMILVTGPTGAGKSTTLYTLIKLLNKSSRSIITLEDPIEYSVKGINQIGVNPKAGLTFANGLRSVLRQDPNIIMVGEIRDEETAGLAINAALTGHLILSTIHTNDSVSTLPRLIDLKIEPYLIASTVNIVISQRLVRRICGGCKKEFTITDSEMNNLKEVVSAEILGEQPIFYKGLGCPKCDYTGYNGRISISEVLVVNNPIRSVIHNKATIYNLKEEAKRQGMTSMIEDGFHKAKAGMTTIEEILRTLHE